MLSSRNDVSQRPATPPAPATHRLTETEIRTRLGQLGQWFHNMNLNGVWTAPNHFLGDYPAVKWQRFADAIPADLTGKTVLDIGCNGGFYSIELKRRGAARVLGIDVDDAYLAQARFAAEVSGVEVELAKMSVYEVDQLGEQFDYVVFMGVLYHLRYPLLALDKVAPLVREGMVFQTMIRGSQAEARIKDDYDFWDESPFEDPDFPRMYFVESRYASDPSNWWIPNRSAAEAMLRSAGFDIVSHPEDEVWVCRPRGPSATPLGVVRGVTTARRTTEPVGLGTRRHELSDREGNR